MRNFRTLPLVGLLLATVALPVAAATEADRIQLLEQQLSQQKAILEQQQRMLEKMTAELERLKTGQDEAVTETADTDSISDTVIPAADMVAESSTEPAPAPKSSHRLSANIYGFAQADAIYDFKRVDPNWDDTLRVTTIPTESGTYGEDGDVVFGDSNETRKGIPTFF